MGYMRNRRLIARLFVTSGVFAAVAVISAVLSAFGAAESSLTFITAPRTVIAAQSSEVITVSLPSPSTGPATVKLTAP